MHCLLSAARGEAVEMREHAARLVVERVSEAAAAGDSAEALEEMAHGIARMGAVVEQVPEVVHVLLIELSASSLGTYSAQQNLPKIPNCFR